MIAGYRDYQQLAPLQRDSIGQVGVGMNQQQYYQIPSYGQGSGHSKTEERKDKLKDKLDRLHHIKNHGSNNLSMNSGQNRNKNMVRGYINGHSSDSLIDVKQANVNHNSKQRSPANAQPIITTKDGI